MEKSEDPIAPFSRQNSNLAGLSFSRAAFLEILDFVLHLGRARPGSIKAGRRHVNEGARIGLAGGDARKAAESATDHTPGRCRR